MVMLGLLSSLAGMVLGQRHKILTLALGIIVALVCVVAFDLIFRLGLIFGETRYLHKY